MTPSQIDNRILLIRLDHLTRLFEYVLKENKRNMLDLTQLTLDVANSLTVTTSAIKLLDTLHAEVVAAQSAPDPIAALADIEAKLEAGTASLAQAVAVDATDPVAVAAVVATVPVVAPVVVPAPAPEPVADPLVQPEIVIPAPPSE